MATGTPSTEAILAQIATYLAAITTTNSYRNTVSTVDRQFLNAESLGAGTKLPALAVFSEGIEYEKASIGATPMTIITMSFSIQGIIQVFPGDTDSPVTAVLKLVEDVRERLLADRTVNNKAQDIFVSSVELGGEGVGNSFGDPPFVKPPHYGFLMNCEAQYQQNL